MRFYRLSLRHEGVLGIGHLVVSLFRRCITFCKDAKSASYAADDIGRGTGKMISDLNFSKLQMKGHVLHLAHAHIKVPG